MLIIEQSHIWNTGGVGQNVKYFHMILSQVSGIRDFISVSYLFL